MTGQAATGRAVRPLKDSDLAAAAELHRLSFPDDAWSKVSLRDLLALPGVVGWIVCRPACLPEPDGFLLARLAADEAEILTLCVTPAQRRRGSATRLLEAAILNLAALGARRLFLEVAEDNVAARALYHDWGFGQVGLRPEYYARPGAAPVGALLLARNLP